MHVDGFTRIRQKQPAGPGNGAGHDNRPSPAWPHHLNPLCQNHGNHKMRRRLYQSQSAISAIECVQKSEFLSLSLSQAILETNPESPTRVGGIIDSLPIQQVHRSVFI